MKTGDYYQGDVLAFFEGNPQELRLYEVLVQRLEELIPEGEIRVQKSQISFYGNCLFAAASLPVRRKKEWREHCLIVTFGLEKRIDSPRIAVAVEPYPNRWTHHVLVTQEEEIDQQLLDWLKLAYQFAQEKGRKRTGGRRGRQ